MYSGIVYSPSILLISVQGHPPVLQESLGFSDVALCTDGTLQSVNDVLGCASAL